MSIADTPSSQSIKGRSLGAKAFTDCCFRVGQATSTSIGCGKSNLITDVVYIVPSTFERFNSFGCISSEEINKACNLTIYG